MWHRDPMNLTRRSWYLLAIIVPVIAWLIGVGQLASRWDSVHEAKPIPIGGAFDAEGQSVVVFTDFIQPDREILCSVTRPKDHQQDIDKPPVDISVDYDATRWHLIGLLDKGQDKMSIACEPEDGLTDPASYAYAVTPSTFEKKISSDFIVWGGIAFGFLIALVIGYARFHHILRGD